MFCRQDLLVSGHWGKRCVIQIKKKNKDFVCGVLVPNARFLVTKKPKDSLSTTVAKRNPSGGYVCFFLSITPTLSHATDFIFLCFLTNHILVSFRLSHLS